MFRGTPSSGDSPNPTARVSVPDKRGTGTLSILIGKREASQEEGGGTRGSGFPTHTRKRTPRSED